MKDSVSTLHPFNRNTAIGLNPLVHHEAGASVYHTYGFPGPPSLVSYPSSWFRHGCTGHGVLVLFPFQMQVFAAADLLFQPPNGDPYFFMPLGVIFGALERRAFGCVHGCRQALWSWRIACGSSSFKDHVPRWCARLMCATL